MKQYSLRTLFAAVIVAAIGCWLFNGWLSSLDARARLISELTSNGAFVARGHSPSFWQAISFGRNTSGVIEIILSEDQLAEIPRLSALSEVQILSLPNNCSDADCRQLPAFPRLHTLSIHSPRLTTRGLSSLIAPKLKKLVLDDCLSLDDSLSTVVSRFPELEHLSLSHTRVGDIALDALGSLQQLNFLDLSGTKVTAQRIAGGKFPALQEFHLTGCAIANADFTGMNSLEVLAINRIPIDQKFIDRLVSLPKLREVYVTCNGMAFHLDSQTTRLICDDE